MTTTLQYAIQNKTTGWRMMGRWPTANEAQAVKTAQGVGEGFEVVQVKGWHHDQKCAGCQKRSTLYVEAYDPFPRTCYECGGDLQTWQDGRWQVL